MIEQGILIVFNIGNVFIDAFKIKRALGRNVPKAVRHGINFTAYGIVVGIVIWAFGMNLLQGIVFAVSAFFNRQISFDIPLNLRRGLKWDYVTTDKPPKAIMDRIEVRIFGFNGRLPVLIYSALWIASIVTFSLI